MNLLGMISMIFFIESEFKGSLQLEDDDKGEKFVKIICF